MKFKNLMWIVLGSILLTGAAAAEGGLGAEGAVARADGAPAPPRQVRE